MKGLKEYNGPEPVTLMQKLFGAEFACGSIYLLFFSFAMSSAPFCIFL